MLRVLRPAAAGRGRREAIVTSREGLLRIEIEGATCDINVDGGWLGRAVVPAKPLVRLASRLPKEDPLEIYIHEGFLHVGSLWMKISPEAKPPPLPASELERLDARTIREFHELTVGQTKTLSGFQRRLPTGGDAELRVMKRCGQAAAILYTLGITDDDIWRLVTRRLAELGPRIPEPRGQRAKLPER